MNPLSLGPLFEILAARTTNFCWRESQLDDGNARPWC